jgi:predicted nucleic acid-binding protein
VKGLLIDTNAYSSLKRSAELATLFERALLLAMNAIVLGELYFGFSLGNREEQNRLELIEFIDSCPVQI